MKSTTIYLDERARERLDTTARRLAERDGIEPNRSALIRRAIELGLEVLERSQKSEGATR